jgi:hypothetical protein
VVPVEVVQEVTVQVVEMLVLVLPVLLVVEYDNQITFKRKINMASTGKKLLRGVAAGLATAGELQKKREQEEKEAERQKVIDDREERRLQIAEKESAARLENLRLDQQMKRVQFNHGQMVKALAVSQYEPNAVGRAVTDWASFGEVYTHNPQASKAISDEAVVYDVGTYRLNDKGQRETDPQTGKFIVDPLPEGRNRKVLADRKAMIQWTVDLTAPEFMLGIERAGRDAKRLREQKVEDIKAIGDAKAQTPEGKDKAALGVAQRENIQADTRLKDAEAKRAQAAAAQREKGESVVTNLDGKEVTFTKEQSQTLRKVLDKVTKQFGTVSSDGEAFRINETKDDPKRRAEFAQDIKIVLDHPDLKRRVREEWAAKGLNMEYFDSVVSAAEIDRETFLELDKKNSKGWFRSLFDSFKDEDTATSVGS